MAASSGDIRSPHQLPSVSVVIPCWNAERWIDRAIRSLLIQNYPKLEIIVVDDGSDDGSAAAISRHADTVRCVSGVRQGASAARNAGLRIARGPLVMFLDADDYIDPGSLAAWAADFIDCDVHFGPFAFERAGVREFATGLPNDAETTHVLQQWIEGWYTPPCAVLWRAEYLKNIGGWKEPSLPRNQDGELVMRAMLLGARARVGSEGMGVYVQHEGPHRVSRTSGKRALESSLEVFLELLNLAEDKGHDYLRTSFGRAFYDIAQAAYLAREDRVGDNALKCARGLGLRGHEGTLAHRAVSSVIGLRKKVRVSSTLRRLAAKLSWQKALAKMFADRAV